MSPEDAFRRVLAARLPSGPAWAAWIDGAVAELAASLSAQDVDRDALWEVYDRYSIPNDVQEERGMSFDDFCSKVVGIVRSEAAS